MKWSYGITTVPSRASELFPRTLASLRAGGFPKPRLFIDGCEYSQLYGGYGLEVTTRFPMIGGIGNWQLALWELFVRNPNYDYYALFQDDIVTCLNLRKYLEQCEYPKQGYWNLITYPKNEELNKGKEGWCLSDQRGKGAQALVFNHATVKQLYRAVQYGDRSQKHKNAHRCIDGCVFNSLESAGYQEFVHMPTLVFHTGEESSLSSRRQPKSLTFKGEDFDALDFLPEDKR